MWRTAEKRFMGHVCLRNPCLLWNVSLHSLPEAWGPWERQHAPPALHCKCIMPIPSLQLRRETCLMQQRSREFYHGVVVSKICYVQYSDCALQMHHAYPFVAAAERNLSHAEKQRVLSRSCRLQDLLRTIQWLCPRFGLCTGCWLSSQLWHVTA